jgi:phage terminase small subunit
LADAVTLTPKQEAFVLAYIETGNASEAYRRAYPKSQHWKPEAVHVKASELLTNGKVMVRVEALRQKHAERHEVTVDSLVDELEEARSLARKTEAPAAMVAATMGKAKITGHIIDKNEHGGKGGGPIQFSRIERLVVYPANSDAGSIPPPVGNA